MNKFISNILKESEENIDDFFKPKNLKSREEKRFKELEIECQKKFHISLDRLKGIYFSFFNQLNEPERSKAKKDFDIEFAVKCGVPKTILDAINNGVNWGVPGGYEYWIHIYDEYKRKDLKKIYFSFYDKLPEPLETRVMKNFDIEFAMKYPLPETIFEAIGRGFDIYKTVEGFDYWLKIYEKYK